MKEVIIYQTEDGCRFNDKESAMKYEELCDKCKSIESTLVNIGRELQYNEYIQQDITTVKNAIYCFMNVVADAIPEYAAWAIQVKNGGRHISHIGRVLSDYNIRCLNNLYFRFKCISLENGKEFQQPYFVTHQEEANIEVS